MNCHICAESATGQCQVCWKFYCAEHGDRLCQTCQQQGGADGTTLGSASGSIVIGRPSSASSVSGGHPADIEGQPLERSIGVVQTVRHGETEVTLVSLELYEAGFVANFILRDLGRGSSVDAALTDSELFRAAMFDAKAADDQGNVYSGFPGRGGGRAGQWRQAQHFTPAVAASQGKVHVSIDQIQWIAQGASARSSTETGPWEFDVPLEGSDDDTLPDGSST